MGSNNYGKTQYLTSSLIPASQTLKTNDQATNRSVKRKTEVSIEERKSINKQQFINISPMPQKSTNHDMPEQRALPVFTTKKMMDKSEAIIAQVARN